MKYSILFILLMICSVASADSVVFYNKQTKEAMFMVSDASKVVLSSEDANNTQTLVIKGNVQLDNPLYDYKVVGKDLVLNTQKISDRNSAKEALEQKRRDEVSARNTAITKLKALGLTDEEILAITK